MRGLAFKVAIGVTAIAAAALSVVAASGWGEREPPEAELAPVDPAQSLEDMRAAMARTAREKQAFVPASNSETASARKLAAASSADQVEPALSAKVTPVADEAANGTGGPILQVGLDGWSSANIEEPFLNLFRKTGNNWAATQKWPGPDVMGTADLWRGGFIDPQTMLPKAVPPGFDEIRSPLIRTGARHDPAFYAGTWVVEWGGRADARIGLVCAGKQRRVSENRIEFDCTENDDGWTNVFFSNIGPEGLQWVRIYRKEHEALVKAGQEFAPEFIDYANDYHVLRTLDIQGANISCVRSVAMMGKKSHMGWGADSRIRQTDGHEHIGLPMGPPIEAMMDMAVAADAALWMHVAGPIGAPKEIEELCIDGARHRENFEKKLQLALTRERAPEILASPEWDSYADEIVRSLEASGYPEDRPLYVETANEVWNNGNPFWWYRDYFLGFYEWLKAGGPVSGYGSMVGVGYMQAHFAVRLDAALERAGRAQNVVFVLAAQNSNPATSEGVIAGFREYFARNNIDPAPYLARAGLSTATYYHEGTSRDGLFKAANDDELRAKWKAAIETDPEGTAKALTDWYLTSAECCAIPNVVAKRARHIELARREGIRFLGDYEGESHDGANALRDEAWFREWYYTVFADGPEGERLTRGWLEALHEQNPDAIISNYRGLAPRNLRWPWNDGLYGEETGRGRALSDYLRKE